MWSWGRLWDLTQSASGGCPVCKLLLDAVKFPEYGEKNPIETEDEVVVYAYTERWEMECGTEKNNY